MDVEAAAEIDMMCRSEDRLLLQFHVTGRCNLQCRHCYRVEGDVQPLSFNDVLTVLKQYKELLEYYNEKRGTSRKGHVNITGGEPFIREDIADILEYLGRNRDCCTYGVLSNGSFLDERLISVLRDTDAKFVQLSIDGDRKTHDALRAQGDYDRVLASAQLLEKSGIRTLISFTANAENYRFLPAAAKECRAKGISRLWSDRLVPIGGGEDMSALAIGADKLESYLNALKKARGGALVRRMHPKTEVTMNRALQFQGGGKMYACAAGNSLITVDEFGRVMPCRRMPIYCGDVFTSTLKAIYCGSEVFRRLRGMPVPDECSECAYSYYCRGGAKCQSYAVYGSFERADPGCPFAAGK